MRAGGPESPLGECLDGYRGILFSHAADFVRCELELDRWLAIVVDAFKRARIRPLALSRRACRLRGEQAGESTAEHVAPSLGGPQRRSPGIYAFARRRRLRRRRTPDDLSARRRTGVRG